MKAVDPIKDVQKTGPLKPGDYEEIYRDYPGRN